mmetsp:Transcript_73084/g.171388  ORF Transcript_73084/g.171388 Transcript_73084/m.171388 type:complete len:243 (+) Transcript_73084:58-786(+)
MEAREFLQDLHRLRPGVPSRPRSNKWDFGDRGDFGEAGEAEGEGKACGRQAKTFHREVNSRAKGATALGSRRMQRFSQLEVLACLVQLKLPVRSVLSMMANLWCIRAVDESIRRGTPASSSLGASAPSMEHWSSSTMTRTSTRRTCAAMSSLLSTSSVSANMATQILLLAARRRRQMRRTCMPDLSGKNKTSGDCHMAQRTRLKTCRKTRITVESHNKVPTARVQSAKSSVCCGCCLRKNPT